MNAVNFVNTRGRQISLLSIYHSTLVAKNDTLEILKWRVLSIEELLTPSQYFLTKGCSP